MVEPSQQEQLSFEANGREPELPGYDQSRAPMLGGARRQWPSVAAYLLSEQHKAHRTWEMTRVWVMRRLRYRLQQRLEKERETSLVSGVPVQAITDETALAEILAERGEVKEALDQALIWRRYHRADEERAKLVILDEVTAFWQERLDKWTLDTGEQNK